MMSGGSSVSSPRTSAARPRNASAEKNVLFMSGSWGVEKRAAHASPKSLGEEKREEDEDNAGGRALVARRASYIPP